MKSEYIEIAAKLEGCSDASIKNEMAKQNRKKYLDNFIQQINKEIDILVEQGENFLKMNIGIYQGQMAFRGFNEYIIPQNCLNILEIEKIQDSFNKRGYKFLFFMDTYDYTKGEIMIYFGGAE